VLEHGSSRARPPGPFEAGNSSDLAWLCQRACAVTGVRLGVVWALARQTSSTQAAKGGCATVAGALGTRVPSEAAPRARLGIADSRWSRAHRAQPVPPQAPTASAKVAL
jgi:hypothetical protein